MIFEEFVKKIKDIALNEKTVYMYGCFGQPVTEKLISDKAKQYPSHYSAEKQKHFRSLIGKGYYAFDCVNLPKGILWGWPNTVYKSNGVPDTSADGMIALCTGVTTDFKKIDIGEALWIPGHFGIYIGAGLAVEATPKWNNKVQITAVLNIGEKKGYNGRMWKKHGKMPYIDYEGETMAEDYVKYVRYGETIKKGAKGSKVKALQKDLLDIGYSVGISGADGSFGPATETAVLSFQKNNGLEVDGSVGPATQKKIVTLLEVPAQPVMDYKSLYEQENKKLADAKKLAQQILNL